MYGIPPWIPTPKPVLASVFGLWLDLSSRGGVSDFVFLTFCPKPEMVINKKMENNNIILLYNK